MQALEVSHLSKSFVERGLWLRKKSVLSEISFRVPRGSVTGFVGVNGSGKTTTMRCLLDFVRPDCGEIKFFGETGLSSSSRKRIGFLPERPYFYDFLTGREFLWFHWQLAQRGGRSDFAEAAESVLKRVDLLAAADILLRKYSKGMLQRVGLAQALLARPELLILDEPMSGLDPDGRALVKEIIREEAKAGTSLFFSSHLLQDMEELCERLYIIDSGRGIFEGPLIDFLSQMQQEAVIRYQDRGGRVCEDRVAFANLHQHTKFILEKGFDLLEARRESLGLERAFHVYLREVRSRMGKER